MIAISRSQRAMQIERRTSRQWSVAHVGVTIPSQTKPDVTYTTTHNTCSCPDALYRIGTPGGPTACKHMLATRLFMGRMK